MIVFLRECKRNYKSTLIWAVSMSALIYLMIRLFPSIAAQQQSVDQLMTHMPKALLSAFGMDKLKMSDILGYYGTKIYPFLLLFGAIYAIMLMANLLAKEESERTIEFLLAKPVTRSGIITSKLLAGLTLIVVFNGVIAGVTYVSFELYKTTSFNSGVLLWLCVGSLLLDVVFALCGMFLSVFITRAKTVYSWTIGIVLATYIIGVAAGMSTNLTDLRYLSPFRYVDATDIILGDHIKADYGWILALCSVVFGIATYVFYNRKDIA